ncbi:sugar ABC transporter ATP-binding protein [Nakamurella silvestris]|nr:sugar ABC transporter ATP-binding protein [Nakamurella silvestris]
MTTTPTITLHGVGKSFGATRALSDVSFSVAAGERLAVLGENGAGKSTLMKILAGVHPADTGTVRLGADPYTPASPAAAMAQGVSIVYQEPSFFEHLTVLENIFTGRELVDVLGQLAWRRMRRQATEAFADLKLDPGLLDRPMGSLSLAEQQQVLIARAVHDRCRVLILDEPTSILTANEAERLFDVVDRLAAAGVAILYITHRFDELARVADRFVILKDGVLVADLPTPADHNEIIRLMSGRQIDTVSARENTVAAAELLTVRGLHRPGEFEDIDLTVHEGEIVGLYGLVGAGRTELALSIFGDNPASAGAMTLSGSSYRPGSAREAIAAGVAYLPEDRKTQGIFPAMSTGKNIAAASLDRFAGGLGRLDRTGLNTMVAEGISRLRIKAPTPDFPITGLSGGHQQKTLFARWLATDPKLFILDEPTRGIDVGTKAEIHSQIIGFADQGMGVLIISSELPELLAVCDRILVMRAGRLVADLRGEDRNEAAILRATLGVDDADGKEGT